jgi:hypothetical protein
MSSRSTSFSDDYLSCLQNILSPDKNKQLCALGKVVEYSEDQDHALKMAQDMIPVIITEFLQTNSFHPDLKSLCLWAFYNFIKYHQLGKETLSNHPGIYPLILDYAHYEDSEDLCISALAILGFMLERLFLSVDLYPSVLNILAENLLKTSSEFTGRKIWTCICLAYLTHRYEEKISSRILDSAILFLISQQDSLGWKYRAFEGICLFIESGDGMISSETMTKIKEVIMVIHQQGEKYFENVHDTKKMEFIEKKYKAMKRLSSSATSSAASSPVTSKRNPVKRSSGRLDSTITTSSAVRPLSSNKLTITPATTVSAANDSDTPASSATNSPNSVTEGSGGIVILDNLNLVPDLITSPSTTTTPSTVSRSSSIIPSQQRVNSVKNIQSIYLEQSSTRKLSISKENIPSMIDIGSSSNLVTNSPFRKFSNTNTSTLSSTYSFERRSTTSSRRESVAQPIEEEVSTHRINFSTQQLSRNSPNALTQSVIAALVQPKESSETISSMTPPNMAWLLPKLMEKGICDVKGIMLCTKAFEENYIFSEQIFGEFKNFNDEFLIKECHIDNRGLRNRLLQYHEEARLKLTATAAAQPSMEVVKKLLDSVTKEFEVVKEQIHDLSSKASSSPSKTSFTFNSSKPLTAPSSMESMNMHVVRVEQLLVALHVYLDKNRAETG